MPDSFGATISGGIQDVSAILPLLGTDQCERHVGSSLSCGFLYAAVTPLSIFGSLGAVRASLSIGLASIPFNRHFGAKSLKNVGFVPTGEVALMITLNGDEYLAETRLLSLLKDHYINDLDSLSIKLNGRSQSIHIHNWRISLPWKTCLIICSLLVAGLSIIPYLHFLIRHDTSRRLLSWLFPIIRAVGSFLCVIPAQFILQNRILMILNQRILFMRINKRLVDSNIDITSEGKATIRWGDSYTSEECLWALYNHLRSSDVEQGSKLAKCIAPILGIQLLETQTTALAENPQLQVVTEADDETAIAAKVLKAQIATAAEGLQHAMSKCSLPLIPFHFMMAIGIVASVVGYIGCFSLVQDSQATAIGRYLWLALEAILSLIRMMIWAYNPGFDDSEGIQLEFDLSPNPPSSMTRHGPEFKVVNERKFREEFNAYCGPMEPLKSDHILYYTLIINTPSKELYITIFDVATKTAILCVRDTTTYGFDLYDAKLYNPGHTQGLFVTMGARLSLEHHLRVEKSFLDRLTAHHDFIMFMLNLDNTSTTVSLPIEASWVLVHSVVTVPEFDEAWDIISESVKDIMDHMNHNTGASITYTNYRRLYLVATTLSESDSQELYNKLKTYFVAYVTLKKKEAEKQPSNQLLQHCTEEWNSYIFRVDHVNHLFTYLNQYWAKKEQRKDIEVDAVKNLALRMWKTYFIQCISDMPPEHSDSLLKMVDSALDSLSMSNTH